MKDMVTNGTGNSRFLKTSLASGTTWESALAMLREGTFPIDLNGLNKGGITQLGSAYSKANVLPDDVCALLGLDSTTAEPKDAFNVVGNPAELWVWEKKELLSPDYYLVDSGDLYFYQLAGYEPGYNNRVVYSVSTDISVAEDGTASLVNPSTVDIYMTSTSKSAGNETRLRGKFFKFSSGNSGCAVTASLTSICYCPSDITFTTQGSNYGIWTNKSIKKVVGIGKRAGNIIEYLSAFDSLFYPEDGVQEGYWYTRLGQIGEGMTKIETGSYVGTGTYGSSNPNSLTFSFPPKLVALVVRANEERYPGPNYTGIIPVMSFNNDDVYRYGGLDDPSQYRGKAKLSIDGKTITWYSTSANYQHNDTGLVFYYFAIG